MLLLSVWATITLHKQPLTRGTNKKVVLINGEEIGYPWQYIIFI